MKRTFIAIVMLLAVAITANAQNDMYASQKDEGVPTVFAEVNLKQNPFGFTEGLFWFLAAEFDKKVLLERGTLKYTGKHVYIITIEGSPLYKMFMTATLSGQENLFSFNEADTTEAEEIMSAQAINKKIGGRVIVRASKVNDVIVGVLVQKHKQARIDKLKGDITKAQEKLEKEDISTDEKRDARIELAKARDEKDKLENSKKGTEEFRLVRGMIEDMAAEEAEYYYSANFLYADNSYANPILRAINEGFDISATPPPKQKENRSQENPNSPQTGGSGKLRFGGN